MHSETGRAQTRMPRRTSFACALRCPRSGFSRAMRRMSCRVPWSVGLRPAVPGRRSVVADGPTGQAAPVKISQGTETELPAAPAPETVLPRLNIERRVGEYAHPHRRACSGVRSSSMPRFASSFHSTLLVAVQMPFTIESLPSGSERDLHSQTCVQAWRTLRSVRSLRPVHNAEPT